MKRFIGIIAIILVLMTIASAYLYYIWFSRPVVKKDANKTEIFIDEGSSVQDLYEILRSKKLLRNYDNFEMYMVIRSFKQIKSGHYVLSKEMTCHQLAATFVRGLQVPITMVVTPSRLPEDLAGKLSHSIALDSLDLIEAFRDQELATSFGFTQADFFTMFVPDSYEVYWNISLNSLLDKMKIEYDSFWNENRRIKAKKLDLDPQQVTVLGSIVYAEQSQHADERSRIAGLYLNRLDRGMLLQSDPTLVFALGDFKKKRVLNVDKEVDSPYNTYKYAGLPPGPIYSPDKQTLDACLNPENNNYLYMCAKEDFSGYHAFASTLSQHNNNARRYQRALNKARIYR